MTKAPSSTPLLQGKMEHQGESVHTCLPAGDEARKVVNELYALSEIAYGTPGEEGKQPRIPLKLDTHFPALNRAPQQ